MAFQVDDLTSFGSSLVAGWSWPELSAAVNQDKWRDMGEDGLARPKTRLFMLQPGRTYRLRFERNWDRVRVFHVVRGEARLVAEWQEDHWRGMGTFSDRRPTMRRGTGLLQLLTWTPLIVEELRIGGVLQRRWRSDREQALRDQQAAGKSR